MLVEPDVGGSPIFMYLASAMYDENIDAELKDLTIRLVFIPFFGLVIPNLTGMIENSRYTWPELGLSYLYFTFIAFAIWQGNRYLLFRLRPRFSWLNQPVRKVLSLVVSNIFYTIPVSVGLVVLWYTFSGSPGTDWNVVFKATALCVVCVVFITHTYETVFLIRSWETDKTRSDRLESERVRAELEALKSQIDPHFIFNSLNTLSHLIEREPARAKSFNDNLADVYRYILANRGRDLVLLREELGFLDSYAALLKIRFGEALQLTVDISEGARDTHVIPPISLQLLVENAIKHNEFTEEHPLLFSITMEEEHLIVRNHIRRKSIRPSSSKLGLANLNERYRLITEHTIGIDQENGEFRVTLPLIRISVS